MNVLEFLLDLIVSNLNFITQIYLFCFLFFYTYFCLFCFCFYSEIVIFWVCILEVNFCSKFVTNLTLSVFIVREVFFVEEKNLLPEWLLLHKEEIVYSKVNSTMLPSTNAETLTHTTIHSSRLWKASASTSLVKVSIFGSELPI